MQTLKIGTRGSKLAIAQTKIVEKALKEHFADLQTEIVVIHTMGDKILDKPLSEIGDKGLFINEFENALAQNKIDIAVHSAKDLPSELKDGLEIICTPVRADARDVLVIKKGVKQPFVIGTSSPRREFYIQKYFPQAQIKTIRGNIDTRLKKLENGEYDAIVLAKAGLDRLKITETLNEKFDFRIFDTDKIVPAACQGIIAVEAKKDFKIYISGGRGTGSGKGTSLFGGQGGNTGTGNSTPDLPARMNRMYNGNQMSAGHTLSTFRNEHATSKTEHLIAHDDDGFVSVYTHGGKSSVGFTPNQVEGKHVIHNHPNGSNFSKADLDNLASTGQKSIAATSKSVTYKVEKNKNFDAKGFAKSLNNAKTTQTDYNKAVGDFLKRNQKKYGYTYTETYHNS